MSFRKAFFWLHLAVGILAGAVILSMSVTGTLLAFEPRILARVERDLRQVKPPSPGAVKIPVSGILRRATAIEPGMRLTSLSLGSSPSATAVATFGREGGTFYIHPYSGELLGRSSQTHDFLHAVEEWHRWLGSREFGKPVTGAVSLGFLFLTLSGFYLWWPRRWSRAVWKKAALPQRGLHGRAREWNWHNAFGFWFAPVLLLTTTTGAVMSYRWANDLLFRAMGSEPPRLQPEGGNPKEVGRREEKELAGERRPTEARRGSRGDALQRALASGDGPGHVFGPWLDSLPALATARLPQWETLALRLPAKAGAPVQVTLTHGGQGSFPRRSQMRFEAVTGKLIEWLPYDGQSKGQRARIWARYLHTGQALGWPGQILMALGAAVAGLLVWTGWAMSWRRFFAKQRSQNSNLMRPSKTSASK